jgi:L-2-hydroxyglutarate oxidase LhgO
MAVGAVVGGLGLPGPLLPGARCDAAFPAPDRSHVGTRNAHFYAPAGLNRKVLAPLAVERDFDVAVIGGGIIGLATAREILRQFPRLRVVVVEKEGEVAPHQTGHNSGVIHAGMYYAPGSSMAQTCVRGAALMYEYCEKNRIPHERTGKLIVAASKEEHKEVELLYDRGTKNGVQGLKILNGEEVRAMEPAVSAAFSALWSPNTGVVDYGLVARSFAADVFETGRGDVKCGFEVLSVEGAEGDRVVITGVEPGQKGPTKAVTARHVITCAGFYADKVARLAGGAVHPKVVAFRGTYYQMKPQYKDIVKTNVYPVPTWGGIPVGVHFTPTVNERRGHGMIVGPGACIAFSREGYKMSDVKWGDLWGFFTNFSLWMFTLKHPDLAIGTLWKDINKAAFLRDAQKLVPSVTEDMVEPSFAGAPASNSFPFFPSRTPAHCAPPHTHTPHTCTRTHALAHPAPCPLQALWRRCLKKMARRQRTTFMSASAWVERCSMSGMPPPLPARGAWPLRRMWCA